MWQLKNISFGLIGSSILLSALAISPIEAKAQASLAPGDAHVVTEEAVKIDCPFACEPWPEKLGLSDEQMEKLITLKSDYEIKTAEKKAQLWADMKQMILLTTTAKTDKDAILALNEKMNALKAELSTSRVNKMLEAMLVMTAKQKEEIHHHVLVHMLNQHPVADKHHHSAEHHH